MNEKNIMEDINEIFSYYENQRELEYQDYDSLNQRSIDITINFLYVLSEAKKIYDNKNIVFNLKSTSDFILFLTINSFEDEIYTKSSLPFEELKDMEKYILPEKLRKQVKYIGSLFIPQNNREYSLIQKINKMNGRTEMQELYEHYSVQIPFKEQQNRSLLNHIYVYNQNDNIYTINDISIVIAYINKWHKKEEVNIFTQVNPEDNRQYFSVN